VRRLCTFNAFTDTSFFAAAVMFLRNPAISMLWHRFRVDYPVAYVP
jgi:hypothetical protein